ncbi:MAG: carbonic anhydrase [Acidimicrobiaceae bacterium]|nr:carbonic anhydrase [Acidimicrobiaceae bacterium]MXZ97483.1 carbonic anhydrase [Acidimicrobiaceae bacterium]MYE96945.1 carbonic anhydrase [Acidimicrobiaceae bacterium]MYH43664.1 carbonic anhydrase [Acidimicrobiaceae bacterium]MYI52785.1 carbonic anhydrase [Acidimicrobiaceae bacterium]
MPAAPARRLAVVACMDARLDVLRILGLRAGEAHIIRDAGGVATDDVIRSLCLSQRALGTREVVLVHHTDCGLQLIDEDRFLAELEAETGSRPSWPLETFADPYEDVAESIRRLRSSPFLPHKDHIWGFVYDVDDGKLHEAGTPAS